jgi:hypothetical protein
MKLVPSVVMITQLQAGNEFKFREKRNSLSLLKNEQEAFTLIFTKRRQDFILSKITIVPENAYDIIESVRVKE